MAKGTFHPIKQELLASQNNHAAVRKVVRILSMSARERVRAFEQGMFHQSVWVFFGHISRKYAASKNLCRKMVRTDESFFCVYWRQGVAVTGCSHPVSYCFSQFILHIERIS